MAIKFKAQELYNLYTTHINNVEMYTGCKIEEIQSAVNRRELFPINNNKFRNVDLAAWMSQKRYENLPVKASKFYINFNKLGVASPNYNIPNDYISVLQDFVDRKWSMDNPFGSHKIRDVNGNIHHDRFQQQFNFPELDEVFLNWTNLLESISELMNGKSFILDQLTFITRAPMVNPTPPHVDNITVTTPKRLPAVVVGMNLDDSYEADGGVQFLHESHRIVNGRMTSLPKTLDGFVPGNTSIGALNFHNCNVIHATPPHLSQKHRRTFYLTFCGLEDAIYGNRIRESNKKYVF